MTHQELLIKAQTLDINIDIYRDTIDILTLNLENAKKAKDVSEDLTNTTFYKSTSMNYVSDNCQEKHYWIIDLQDGQTSYKANTEAEFWNLLKQAINQKERR